MIRLMLALGLASVVALQAEEPGARPRVIFLGDSLADGYGLDRSESFPDVLQAYIEGAGLSFQIVNAGVSGGTLSTGIERLPALLEGGAAVLVIELGGNDGLRGRPAVQIEQDLLRLIDQARELSPGIRIVLAGMFMPRSQGEEYRTAFAAVFPRVAKQTGSDFIPDFLKGVGGIRRMNQEDFIHPTAEGQRQLAENVWKVLYPILKKISQK